MRNKYLSVYQERYCDGALYEQLSSYQVAADIIVVIPCYKESLAQLNQTLASLNDTDQAAEIEVMLLVNYKATDSSEIKASSIKLYDDLVALKERQAYKYKLEIFIKEIQHKKAGVGIARKLLMDCAFLRYQSCDKTGLIVNLDADTVVDASYITAIKAYFTKNKACDAASLAFEHKIALPHSTEDAAIIDYELHLRYFINMQRFVGLPYAYQTIGSAMVVRSDAYAKEGGMSRKQAGEDFYFLHKFSKNLSLRDITRTIVYPSSRSSDRVPFGTGKAVNDIINNTWETYKSYNPQSFVALKEWLNQIQSSFHKETPTSKDFPYPDDKLLASFLELNKYHKAVTNDIIPTGAGIARIKKFFAWFDAFKLMKYLHSCREEGREDKDLMTCCKAYSSLHNHSPLDNKWTYLQYFRNKDLLADYDTQWRAALISSPSNISAS